MQKLSLYCLLLGLVLTGCTKLLDQEPYARANGDTFWETANDAEKGVAGTYALLRDALADGRLFEYGDLTTDLFRKGWNAGNDKFYLPGELSVTSSSREWASAGMENPFQDWTGFYKVVNFSNVAIRRIGAMPEAAFGNDVSRKNKLLGEAHFLRGLAYFMLARIWGDVPLVTDPIESTEQSIDAEGNPVKLARSAEKDILQLVFSDATKAISLLSYGTVGSVQWGIRANKASAQALEAHAALWIASRTEPDKKDQFIDVCTKAIDSIMTLGNYTLAAYVTDTEVKNMFKGKSTEAVFELNISPEDAETFRIDNGNGLEGKTALFPTRELDNNYNRVYWIPLAKKALLYEGGATTTDRRANLFLRAWNSSRTEPAHDNPALWPEVTCLKKFENMVADDQATAGEYRAFFAGSNIPIFRLSELVLLAAEAHAKKNNTARAKELLLLIRQRAGLNQVTVPDSELVTEVLKERRRELIGEGHIFFDYIRNNSFPDVSAMNATRISRKGYFWPVRYNNIRKNPALVQTSYWIGKVFDN